MATSLEVTLDEERQIIRQTLVDGVLELEDFNRVVEVTEAYRSRLRNPNDVRILLAARDKGRPTAAARKAMVDALRRPSLTRLAVYDMGALGRVMIRFLSVATGLNKIRGFADEQQAVDWLAE